MKSLTIFLLVFCSIFAAASTGTAQIELVPGDYFPADQEFQELKKVESEESFENPARLSKIEGGGVISDVGFQKYEKRVYAAGDSGSLSIEVFTLLDARAAYSALTLLRNTSIQDGPPGDGFTASSDSFCFAQGKRWVRIMGRNVAQDLPKRVAVSVSNRMGARRMKPPSLVSHLPRIGYDPSSLRYYPSSKVFENHSPKAGGTPLRLNPEMDMEIAQARYTTENRPGTLSLLSFPTDEMAEEYYNQLGNDNANAAPGSRTYMKRSGPIVGILQGSFDPAAADKLLSSIKFSYAIQWVDDKKPKVMWGVPVGILGTVVKSLFFVVILCGLSVIVGIVVAALRFMRATKESPDQQQRKEITRLKMR